MAYKKIAVGIVCYYIDQVSLVLPQRLPKFPRAPLDVYMHIASTEYIRIPLGCSPDGWLA